MIPITIEGLHKKFGEVTALNGISLRIEKGELFFLLGPSGCGKTTLLKLIGGYLKPQSGSILLRGKDVTHTPPEEHRLQCAPCATLASTAHLQGLDQCLALAKLVHTLQAALSPLPASPAPWARSRMSPDSRRARHAFPACTAALWDSAIQPAPAEQDRTLLAAPQHPLAPVAASAHFSPSQDKVRAYPAVRACTAQRQASPSKLESVLSVLNPEGPRHPRHALRVLLDIFRTLRAKDLACPAMREHFAAVQGLRRSAGCAPLDLTHLAAPARLPAALVPQASTVPPRG